MAGEPSSPSSARRLPELIALFGAVPTALAFAPGWIVIPAILAGAALCLTVLLRDPTFERRRLWDAAAGRRVLARVLARTAVGCLALLALVAATRPEALLALPRTRPGLWAAVMIGYPVFSAFPQELVFRTFFFHRYAGLVTHPAARIALSAALFGYAHVVLHNLPAIALSTVGGLLFASTYARSRSTFAAALEHALYGAFIFTVGLGTLFYGGARAL